MRCFAAVALVSMTLAVQGQTPATQPAVTTTSTLVLVPALVHTKAGEPIFSLSASDFNLTDDGVPQKLNLEEDTGGEPLALVVDLEVGGAGTREFDKLGALTPMLDAVIGNVPHTVAVVGFDSEPALVQPFTPDIDKAASAIFSLTPGCTRQHHQDNCADPQAVHDASLGDNGAAILDSLAFSVDLLRKQPATYRRAILLISETLDRGSHISIEDAVRALSDTNTTIYSIGFSTAKSEAAHYAHRQLPTDAATGYRQMQPNTFQPGSFTFFARTNHLPNPPGGCMGKDPDPDPDKSTNKLSQAYDCAGQLLPPLLLARMAAIAAFDGLQRNIPETVAGMTGGEYFKLTDAKSLERSLAAISNSLPNRYILSFQPVQPHAGPHALDVRVKDRPALTVNARSHYWVDGPASTKP